MVMLALQVSDLLTLLHVLTVVSQVLGEPFYQRRDHLDQTRYLTVHNDNVVKDRNDAEFMLFKYGYLKCQVRRRRREATRHGRGGRVSQLFQAASATGEGSDSFNPWDNFELSEEGGIEVCDEAEVQKAIREYQRTYNLPPTGQLDEETKVLMSTSRCGNADNEEAAQTADNSTDASTASPSSPTPQPPSSTAPPSPSLNVHMKLSDSSSSSSRSSQTSSHGHHHHHHHKSEDSNKSGQGSAQRLWKRAVNRIRDDDASQLLRLLKGATTTKDTAESRHKRYLQEYINKLKRDDPQLLETWTEEERSRSKRSIQVKAVHEEPIMAEPTENTEGRMSVVAANEIFNKELVRWRLLDSGYSTRIPVDDQRATVDLAFRMWSEVIPLKFVEDTTSNINTIDIEVAFGRGSHQNCRHDFDGNGGELAHSQHAGNMHFDDEENFKSIRSYSPDGIYLLRVAVHEIGHVLGLAHTNKSQSIMYAIYHGAELSPEFELSREDRKEVQKIYGVCKGKFSTVFDWVRKRPDNQFIYNTYFFRENHYWMYENHANRTRYGDPLYIAREWNGVPNNPDAYVHTWYFTGTDIVDEAFFFKGEYYYKYDSEHDVVYEGWPRLISEHFGPKPGETDGVPDNIDAVFFDMRDKNLYFFKDDTVYVYDPKELAETRGCCVRKRKIWEEFPPAEGQNRLPDNLDAVYYSYQDKMQYFFKGEKLWKNIVFDPRQRRIFNSVQLLGNWWERWMDICDVQAH